MSSLERRGRLAALLTATAAASLLWATAPLPVAAQSRAAEQAQAGERRTFDIPPQSLGTALGVFGQQSGRQITVDGALVRGISTPGVSGTMTVDEALQRLLAGSGLTYSTPSSTTIAIRRPDQPAGSGLQLDPVQVQGLYPVPPQAMIDNIPPPYAGGQVATGGQLGLLGNRGVMDTPFNQTSYTAQKAKDQQAKTIRDVLADDPSVRSYFVDGMPGSDNVYIRGFPVINMNMAYGGLYGMLPNWTVMSEMAERVEVLKGPSAMLNGMPPNGAIGGTINVVSKRAPNEELTQITANYLSAGQFGGHADVARRFGADKQFGVRFNGVFKAGPTAIENNSDQRSLGLLGLDYRGEHVRLSADLGYQYQYIGGMQSYLGVAAGIPLPWAPSARKNQGQPWGYQERKDLFGVARAELDMTERVTAYIAFGAHDSRMTGLYAAQLVATDGNGTATAQAPLTNSLYNTFLTGEAGIRGTADTGPIGHEFALNATAFSNDAGQALIRGTAFASNFYNPAIIAPPNIPTGAANKTSTQGLYSVGVADTLTAADKRIQLTAGLRWQQVMADNFNGVTGVRTSGYDQTALSPTVALVVKPFWENVSFYGNWIQGLQQGVTVSAPFANAGEVFPPFKSTQYEAGVKVDLGKFTTTASVFQISRPSILTNTASNTQFLGGEQVNQGLELNMFGEPMEGVRVLGGFMLLNAVLTKTQGGSTDGWIAPFSPGFNLSLAGEWDLQFVRSLTLNGRVVYTGSQYFDTTFPRRSLPDWTRFDIGVRYAFENPGATGKLLVARFNIENVLGANYWAGGDGPSNLNLGAPMTFRLSLTADF